MFYNGIMEKSVFAQVMAKKERLKKVFGMIMLARLIPSGQEIARTVFIYTQQYS